jgi:hypothetical protein
MIEIIPNERGGDYALCPESGGCSPALKLPMTRHWLGYFVTRCYTCMAAKDWRSRHNVPNLANHSTDKIEALAAHLDHLISYPHEVTAEEVLAAVTELQAWTA